jgi:CBS domain-containing protein
VHTIGAENSARDAAQLMRDHALRRLPVTDGGQLVGIISIGDLAVEQDPGSALADISAAPPND